MSEVVKKSGVGRGTVQHYLREGLLPPPVKTKRNMAWYHPGCVERIRVIQKLRETRYLPLSEIRRMIGDGPSLTDVLLEAQQAALASMDASMRSDALTVKEASRAFDLTEGFLADAERLGLAHPRDQDGRRVFTAYDLEVLAAMANLKRLGFTYEAGFGAKDLVMYRESMQALLEREVRAFLRVVGKRKRVAVADPVDLARKAVDGATLLLLALRRKLLADILSGRGVGSQAAAGRGGRNSR
jgi:DNA-binding transcriptional MerR regulator